MIVMAMVIVIAALTAAAVAAFILESKSKRVVRSSIPASDFFYTVVCFVVALREHTLASFRVEEPTN